MYNLVIGAIFKNESNILDEWIQHYLNQGVEYFYLIDNGSTDNYQPIIDKYQSYITLYKDPTKYQQIEHYNKYILPNKTSKWMMIVDLDEFVYSRNGFPKIVDYLDSLSNDITCVVLFWKMFGSNGHIKQPSSVLQNFTKRAKDFSLYINQKRIFKSEFVNQLHQHYTQPYAGKCIYANNKEYSTLDWNNIDEHNLHLNHYPIQSFEWFMNVKATRGDNTTMSADNIRNESYFKQYDLNEQLDEELCKKSFLYKKY